MHARQRKALFVAVCTAMLFGASAANADAPQFDLPVFGRTTLSLTSTSLLRYRGQNYDANEYDDDFGSLYQRFNVALQGDELRFELRLDAFVPHTVFGPTRCESVDDPRCYLSWDLRPERMTLRWQHDDWTVEAGDSQAVIGRGIAMSFRKVDPIGIDNALRGAHVRFDDQSVRFAAHLGVANPQNQDPVDLRIVDDPDDVVAGVSGGFTMPGSIPISLSVHAVRYWFEDEEDALVARTDRAADIVGASLSAPSLGDGALSLYLEADAMRRTFEFTDETQTNFGRAVYGSAQLSTGDVTLLAEWKDYRDFLVAPSSVEARPYRIYNAAPRIELDGPQRLRAIGNQRGGGLRLDLAFLPGPWSVSLGQNLYGLAEDPSVDPFDGVFVTHSWLSVARRQEVNESPSWSLNLRAGFRREMFIADRPDHAQGDHDRSMVHGRAELNIAEGEHSIEVIAHHRHEWQLEFAGYREFDIGGASLTYAFGVPLSVTVSMQWSDFQPGIVERRAQYDYNIFGGVFYPSLALRWTFEPGTYLSAFAGQTPGGQQCSSGVCRNVPPFEGVRLSFVGRM